MGEKKRRYGFGSRRLSSGVSASGIGGTDNSVDGLPDSCLLRIFRYVWPMASEFELVCKRFCGAVKVVLLSVLLPLLFLFGLVSVFE